MKNVFTFGLIAVAAYVLYEHFAVQPSATIPADPTGSVQPSQAALFIQAPSPAVAGNIAAPVPASSGGMINPSVSAWAPTNKPSVMWGCWTLDSGQRVCA